MSDLHELAPLYALGCLDAADTEAFERHLPGCALCTADVAKARETAAQLSRTVAQEPPPALRASILARIAETPQQAETPQEGADADSGTSAEASPHPARAHSPANGARRPANGVQPEVGANPEVGHDVDDHRPARPPRPDRLRRAPYLLAAAAVIIALAMGAWGLHAHRVAQVAQQQSHQLTRLLTAGDATTTSGVMSGGGRGTVVTSRSQDEAVFVADHLPTLASGRVYQLWTINGTTPTPAGLMTSSGAPVLVVLPQAALSANAVAVTIEPAGGSTQPSKPLLLTLPLDKG